MDRAKKFADRLIACGYVEAHRAEALVMTVENEFQEMEQVIVQSFSGARMIATLILMGIAAAAGFGLGYLLG